MDKWHWTSPRQIKVEKTVIYSFSLFENAHVIDQYLSVSECLYVCLLSSVFMWFCVSSFHVWGDCVSPFFMRPRAKPGPIYKVSWPEGSRLREKRWMVQIRHSPIAWLNWTLHIMMAWHGQMAWGFGVRPQRRSRIIKKELFRVGQQTITKPSIINFVGKADQAKCTSKRQTSLSWHEQTAYNRFDKRLWSSSVPS